MNAGQKKCTLCLELKSAEEFIKKCGKCKPCRAIHRKEYRSANLESFKTKDKKYHEKHRDNIRQQQAEYYAQNKEKICAQRKKYREEHADEHREWQRKYYHANLNRKISLVYRNRVRRELKSGKDYLEYLGCSIDHLRLWFDFNFELDGFSWDNYNVVWEIDHVLPCCTFDLQNIENVRKCFGWRNTKPELKKFNKKKSGKIIPFQVLELELRLYLFDKQNKSLKT